MTLLRLLAALSLLLAAAPGVRAEGVDPAKAAEIRQLLQLTGVEAQVGQMSGQMIETFKKTMPQVPSDFWDAFQKEFDASELIGLMIPIYDKYYTKDDLDGLVAFYQTPLGKKLAATLPLVSREGMAVGQKWGQAKAEKIMQELQARQSGAAQ